MRVQPMPMEQLGPLLAEQLDHGQALLPVTGGSMLPALRGGRDVVRLSRVEGTPKRGDILLYRRASGQYVLHRLIRIEGEGCICCGDNQWEPEPVPLERVIARVTAIRRGGRWLDCASSTPYRIYTGLWTGLFPVRRPIIAVRRLLGRLRRRIRRKYL